MGAMSGRRTRACAVTGQCTPGVRLMESFCARLEGSRAVVCSVYGVRCVRNNMLDLRKTEACPTSMYATHLATSLAVCVCVFKS